MAELGIQKKQGSNWLWWIIALVVLALLAWWLIAANSHKTMTGQGDVVATPATVAVALPETEAMATTPAMGEAPTPGGAITDLSTLTTAATAGQLAGRPVMLSSVPVQKAVSDKGFWAGSGSTSSGHIFVVRGNQTASYTAPDGAVTAGKSVMIYGTAQAMPADLTQQSTAWNLTSTDKQTMAAQPLYIMADSVRIAR